MVAQATGRPVAQWPAECVMRPASGGGADDPVFVFFIDDAILVEVQWGPEGARCLDFSRSLDVIHEQAMGERLKVEEPLL